MNSFFRSSPESAHSEALHEAILASVSRVRGSLPEQYRVHFDTLRQEIIDFAQAHEIPREALSKPDLLRETVKELPLPDLERLATLLERFEHLIVYHELMKEEIDPAKAIEYGEKFYHLREQYDFQVEFLEQVGILKEGIILGIDGHEYPVPTLEQIAVRLFERRKELKTKHDQGFTKLLLVPFGMNLDTLRDTLKQFLLSYKKSHPTFELNTNKPLWTWDEYQGADMGDSPKLVYYPQSFTREDHGGKTKAQILKDQGNNQDSFPGWTIHLLQPSNPDTQDTETPKGFAPIPRKGQGKSQGDENPRFPLETRQSSKEYLSILQKAQDDEDSPYHGETGMTPEDWIIAFMIHLTETGQPLDNWQNNKESISYLTGAFFSSSTFVPFAFWSRSGWQAHLGGDGPHARGGDFGFRSSVMI